MTRTLLLVPAFALAMAGCAIPTPGKGPLAITLQAIPARDGSINLHLRNSSGKTVGYNLCASTLERNRAGAWEDVRSDRLCTLQIRTIVHGEQESYRYEPSPRLAPGEYRATTLVDAAGRERGYKVTSDPFAVK
jgi:hypothetical protein